MNNGADMPSARRRVLLILLLVLATLAVFSRALTNDFVYYDDGLYVFDNVHVRNGFSWQGVAHVFRSGETGTWQPVTMLSHMFDAQLFGLRPWGHHLSGVLIHSINAALLALALTRLTRDFYPSLAVAAVFALHPAHVESVAWVSERKDVLSTLFWMLGLLAYERYARRSSAFAYAAVVAAMAVGLMAKPMLVTLPCVLLLLDYWPLRRISHLLSRDSLRVVPDKLFLFALAAASSVVTLVVQRQNEAIVSLENLPMATRLANVAVSYVKYIGLMLWPAGLAIDYPHPKDTLATWQIAGSVAFLAAVTLIVFMLRRRAPYLLVGWLWYLGTLVPVVGIIHVGEQGMADRYTYIPSIGLTIAVVFAVADALAHRPSWRSAVAVACVALCVGYAAMTWRQIGFWKNTESLWARAAAVNPRHERALRNLADILIDQRRFDEAIKKLDAAVRLEPRNFKTWQNLGYAHQQLGQHDIALYSLQQSLALKQDTVETRNLLGVSLLATQRPADAVPILQEALRLRPWDSEVASNLGVALCQIGRVDDAVAVLKEAVRINGNSAKLRNNYGIALRLRGDTQAAVEQFQKALEIDPTYEQARRNLELTP